MFTKYVYAAYKDEKIGSTFIDWKLSSKVNLHPLLYPGCKNAVTSSLELFTNVS